MKKIVAAKPFEFSFDPQSTALIVIDMQRDFVLPGGFGEALGNNVEPMSKIIPNLKALLECCRKHNMLIIHTREGHRQDLSDCPPAKLMRGGKKFIGEPGPMGRILVRGEYGHDFIDELKPLKGEIILDKPGKDAFYATDLELILQNKGIKSLIVCGVTTEVCVQTTCRAANDRGYELVVPSDCTASYFPEFYSCTLDMITAQGAIIGWVSTSNDLIAALEG